MNYGYAGVVSGMRLGITFDLGPVDLFFGGRYYKDNLIKDQWTK